MDPESALRWLLQSVLAGMGEAFFERAGTDKAELEAVCPNKAWL